MQKKISKLAEEIYREFKSDISEHEHKVRDRWNTLFDQIDNAVTIKQFYAASNSLFQFGAQYIREDSRYEKFRNMYHSLGDIIEALEQERKNGT